MAARDLQKFSLRRLSSNLPIDFVTNGRLFFVNGFKFRGCFNSLKKNNDFRNDGVHKGRTYAPYRPSVSEDLNHQGNTIGFRDQPSPERIMVAVDVDEVLGTSCQLSITDIRVHEFFKTPYFKKGIYPIPGAQRALQKLSKFCNLSVVTSRQYAIKDHKIKWIENHYPGLFEEIHFGNHFALDGQSRSKSDICRSLGAKVLIDDNPRYAIECVEVGIKVLLFDYENSYPWCKTDYICQHPLVTKVHNWEEVENQLAL